MAARDAGFSLVEMMAAMFIAALAGAAVIVAIPPTPPEEEKTALALALAIQRAQRVAMLDGAPLGLTLAGPEWRFSVWNDGAWRALDDRTGPGAGTWPEGALVSLTQDGALLEDLNGDRPDLVFGSAGVGAFSIHIDGRDARAVVRGDAQGGVMAERPDA